MKTQTRKMLISAMFAAIECVATMLIVIPSPLKGYLNLGDCVVLLAGWLLSPGYGFIASGIGAALADVFSGYIIYAPATFVIKGLMAVICSLLCKQLKTKTGDTFSRILSGAVAEIVMISGYYLFEGFMYGFLPSLVNIPANAVQGAAGLFIAMILIKIFKKIV